MMTNPIRLLSRDAQLRMQYIRMHQRESLNMFETEKYAMEAIQSSLDLDCDHVCKETRCDNIVTTKCDNCSQWVCDGCSHKHENELYCEDCYHELFYMCGKCEDMFSRNERHSVDETIMCPRCFNNLCSTCQDCGESHFSEDMRGDDNITVCRSCYDLHYSTCDGCECITRNIQECSECENYYCESCINDHNEDCNQKEINLEKHSKELIRDGSDAIADYHQKTDWEYQETKRDLPTSPFFGVELELECDDDSDSSIDNAASYVGKELKGLCVASHDGSLNHGFEIVMTPHKRQAFREIKWHKILKGLSKLGCTSFDKATCGIHVHIQRTEFLRKTFTYKNRRYSNAELYQKLVNRLQQDVKRFSRRKDSQISQYCNFKESSCDRYCAVNLSNSKTIEVRIWRGTLEPTRFKANVLFSLALYDFMVQTNHTIILQQDTAKLYRALHDWLLQTPEYTSLIKYFRSKSLFGFGRVEGEYLVQSYQEERVSNSCDIPIGSYVSPFVSIEGVQYERQQVLENQARINHENAIIQERQRVALERAALEHIAESDRRRAISDMEREVRVVMPITITSGTRYIWNNDASTTITLPTTNMFNQTEE